MCKKKKRSLCVILLSFLMNKSFRLKSYRFVASGYFCTKALGFFFSCFKIRSSHIQICMYVHTYYTHILPSSTLINCDTIKTLASGENASLKHFKQVRAPMAPNALPCQPSVNEQQTLQGPSFSHY